MNCQKCNSVRVAEVNGKTSDLCHFFLPVSSGHCVSFHGYVPKNVGIGGGDYLKLKYCLDCGQIQGKFPIEKETIEDLEGVSNA